TPIVIFSFVPEILYRRDWIDPIYMGWFILFFPLSFAYLIAAKRLYDIDIILRRIFYMTIISLIPSAVLVGLIGILFTKEAPIQKLLFIFILFVIILTFMLYSLEYFSTKLERVMFPKKYNLQSAVKKIAKNLSSISSFRELRKIILVDIVSTLQVFGGAVVFKYHDTIETISEGDIDIYEVEKLVLLDLPENTSYSAFEINRNEEYTSYLIMTQKKTNTLLGQEETQWLNLIISYMAVSLENVYLIRKLTRKLEQLASQIPNEQASNDFIWFRKLMFELQEKERLRIATDIHDTTMQDLFFLKRRLTALSEKYPFDQANSSLMDNCISFIDIINTNLRQNCFELHPHLLQEIGLVQTIEKVIDLEMPICAFEIEFRATGVETIEAKDLWTKRHIFRMVQELLNNAKKHSQASHVKIYIKATQANFHLLYEDNGIGYEPDQVAEKEIGNSGIGIEQMKSRVLSLNGHFDLDTSEGHGVKLEITFPLKEGKTA
ncbi:MAG: ATPase/histidine kinase/DNA gyrase domain protein, partial [Bacilli bacterium]|nr:ATPase/histidine kinase/DNA gyrase domain protein [Bacilli bacterium]